MRTTTRLAALLALALAALPGLARAQVKLGYVDLQRALEEVDEGKAAKALLTKDFEEKKKLVSSKTDELKKLQADFDKQSMVMSAEAKAQKGAEIERKGMEAQELLMRFQQELAARERDATAGIGDKMRAIIGEIAQADGLTMVLTSAAVVYGQPSLDVTNELVRKYNARHGAGAKKADAPAKKADAPAKK